MENKEKYIDRSWKAKMVEKELYKDTEITLKEKLIEEFVKFAKREFDVEIVKDNINGKEYTFKELFGKVFEDSVVLSGEEYYEYQKFKSFMEHNDWESVEDIETTLDKCQEVLYERLQQERKETAEKILNEIDCVPTNEVNELNHLRLLKMNIAKQCGVEIKE